MHKHCSNVCKLHLCLATESTNSTCACTIVTAVLQQQCSQTELIFWITYVYSKVRSEVLGPMKRQNKTVLFLGDTMQIDIQAKTFVQNTGTDHLYYSVTEKSTAIFRTFFSRVPVLILLHILYKCWPIYIIFKAAAFGSNLQNHLYFHADINSAYKKIC